MKTSDIKLFHDEKGQVKRKYGKNFCKSKAMATGHGPSNGVTISLADVDPA